LPPAPPPPPTPVDENVVNAAREVKRRSAAAGGYAGTNATGGQGVVTPAFTTGTPGFKALMGQ
jgi:hypothetical protein